MPLALLLALHAIVLRGHDLPLAPALEPGIGPDLAYLRFGMRFVFADCVLGAIDNGEVFTDEVHLGIVDSTIARPVRAFFVAQFVGLGVALTAGAGALEFIGQ